MGLDGDLRVLREIESRLEWLYKTEEHLQARITFLESELAKKDEALPAVGSRPSAVPSELGPVAPFMVRYDEWRLPPCIYFLVQNGTVVYVGQTVNLNSRIRSHQDNYEFDEVLYLPLKPWEDLDYIESYFIQKLSPKFNRTTGKFLVDPALYLNRLLNARRGVANATVG